MRLSHFFVVVAATFLATGALADTDATSVSEPSHRNLRKHHHALADEERGFNSIPREKLQVLAEKVDDIIEDAAAAMRKISTEKLEQWHDGLNPLLRAYKKRKPSRISDY